jgi:hypothetical protein
MQALGQSALPCRVKDGGASDSPWIFRIWFSDGDIRVFRWIDGILDWRWIWLWRGPQPVLESRIFIGMHATLMLAKRQRQPLIMEGRSRDQFDTAHLDRVALLQFAHDLYPLADELLSCPMVVQLVVEFCHWILQQETSFFLFRRPVNASSS